MPRGVYDRSKVRRRRGRPPGSKNKKKEKSAGAQATIETQDQWWADEEDLRPYVPTRVKRAEKQRLALTTLEVFIRHLRLTRTFGAATVATVSELGPYGVTEPSVNQATAAWRAAHPEPTDASRASRGKSLEVLVASLGRQVQELTVEIRLMRDGLQNKR